MALTHMRNRKHNTIVVATVIVVTLINILARRSNHARKIIINDINLAIAIYSIVRSLIKRNITVLDQHTKH